MQNFESPSAGTKPVALDFFADWCGACQPMAPILQEVKQHVGKRAIDKNHAYAAEYVVLPVPTLLIFKEGPYCLAKIWRCSCT